MCGLANHWNPSFGIARISSTETRKHSNVGWYFSERLRGSCEVTSRHHNPIANERTARETEQARWIARLIDEPDHERSDVGKFVFNVHCRLSRKVSRCDQQREHH